MRYDLTEGCPLSGTIPGNSIYVFVVCSVFLIFFAVWAGACCVFLLFGRGAPPKQQKIQHAPAQTAKKKNTLPPLSPMSPQHNLIFSKYARALHVSPAECCLGEGVARGGDVGVFSFTVRAGG